MTKLQSIALIMVLACFVLTSAALLTRGHDWGDDFALYIRQAESIVKGTESHLIAQNEYTNVHSSQAYGSSPWGYPLFLAFFYRVFGLNPIGLKMSNLISLLVFLLVFFWLIKDRLSPLEGVGLVAILAFCPKLIDFQNYILTDLPFLALSTVSILLMVRWGAENEKKTSPIVKNLVLGAVIFLASFVRLNGSLLLVTLLGCQTIFALQHRKNLLDLKRVILNFGIPYLVFGILWGIASLVFPSGLQNISSAVNVTTSPLTLRVIYDNAIHYSHDMDQGFLLSVPGASIVYGFMLAFLTVGVMARAKQDYAFLIFSFLTLALTLSLPFTSGTRYLFPVFPFFIYFSFQGMKISFSGLEKYYRSAGLTITYLFWIMILVVFAATSVKIARANLAANRHEAGPFDTESTEMFSFVKANTRPDSVIVFFKPRAMLLFTDRNSIMIDECTQLVRGDYVVLYKGGSADQIVPAGIGSCGLNTEPVFENANFIAYKIDH